MGGCERKDLDDPIVDSWIDWVEIKQKDIWWEELYKVDIASRKVNIPPPQPVQQDAKIQLLHGPTLEERLMNAMEDRLKVVHEKSDGVVNSVDNLSSRLKEVEDLYRGSAGFNYGERSHGWREYEHEQQEHLHEQEECSIGGRGEKTYESSVGSGGEQVDEGSLGGEGEHEDEGYVRGEGEQAEKCEKEPILLLTFWFSY